MKTFRNIILSAVLVLAAASVASCDLGKFGEDAKHGNGDAVVGFASDSYSFKESAGIVRVPVAITGSPLNYPLTFDIKAEALNLADLDNLDKLVLFTQTKELKDNGEGTVYVEFKIFDDTEINDDRTFKLSISNLEGATLAEVTETTVTIKDNDNNPYEKLWGDWTLHCLDYDLAAYEFTVSISGGFTPEEEEANADKLLVCVGLEGYQWALSDGTGAPLWYMGYDADAKLLSIKTGYTIAPVNYVNFGLSGDQTVELWYWNPETGEASKDVEIAGTWSEDLNSITFDQTAGLVLRVYADGAYKGVWDRYSKITMTRK